MAITQIIATLPAVLNDSETFYEDIAIRNNSLVTVSFPSINTWATQANALAVEVNDKAAQVADQAVDGGYSQDYINSNFVGVNNTQDITAIKTFTVSPIVPTPTTDYQAANKKYIDDNNKINTLTNKTTPVDADEMVIADSTSSFSLKKLSFSNLKDNIVEVGTTRLVPVSTVPTGYLEMNGALLSRTAYSKLFAYLGTTYGAGDGSTTFALPDTRGEFIRGWDNGRGVDSGRTIGSWQVDLFKSHTHTYTRYESTTNRNSGTIPVLEGAITQNTGSTGGAETRPRNIAMMYCIKY